MYQLQWPHARASCSGEGRDRELLPLFDPLSSTCERERARSCEFQERSRSSQTSSWQFVRSFFCCVSRALVLFLFSFSFSFAIFLDQRRRRLIISRSAARADSNLIGKRDNLRAKHRPDSIAALKLTRALFDISARRKRGRPNGTPLSLSLSPRLELGFRSNLGVARRDEIRI